jgi:hypothetical protein
MKSEFRRELAQQSFEEKIRKVGELIRLSRKMKLQRLRGSSITRLSETRKPIRIFMI